MKICFVLAFVRFFTLINPILLDDFIANAIFITFYRYANDHQMAYVQPRYLLTSLALNDFAIGILITPLGILPALLHCWPYGEIFCQIQVNLRSIHPNFLYSHRFFFSVVVL